MHGNYVPFQLELELPYEEVVPWEGYSKTSNIEVNLRFGAPPAVCFEEYCLLSPRKISSWENEVLGVFLLVFCFYFLTSLLEYNCFTMVC